MTNLELYAWTLFPAVLFAFQVVVKKGFLDFTAVVRIEFGPVFNPMTFKPFFFLFILCKCFKISAWVKAVSAPVSG